MFIEYFQAEKNNADAVVADRVKLDQNTKVVAHTATGLCPHLFHIYVFCIKLAKSQTLL